MTLPNVLVTAQQGFLTHEALYAIASQWPGSSSSSQGAFSDSPVRVQARANQRIGLATAPSPAGPWTRPDRPILETRPDKWDAMLTTNAAPYVAADGSVLMLSKSTRQVRRPTVRAVLLAPPAPGAPSSR